MQRSRGRTAAALVLLAGVVILALGGVVGAVLEDPPRRTSTTTTIATTTTTLPEARALSGSGAELQDLIDLGRTVTHHAVYSVTDPELPSDLTQALEVWRDGDRYRADIVESTATASRRQSTIVSGSRATACETVDGEETCKRTNALPSDLPAAFVRSIVTADPVPQVVARDGDVAGYNARCFSAEGVGELCLAEDGVMLSITLEEAYLVATTIDDEVPESTFDNTTGVVDDPAGTEED
ncbi:MAG: hypothetical protein Q8K58_06060 [Acidimicrobiales bacterium]|nr:hypothetical protein [Acidimicrobiales bacterium]